MRNISFSMTTPQVRARIKDVTRRVGWLHAKPGMRLWAVEKAQGLKKGEHVVRICMIEVVDVRRERLDRMITDRAYGLEECRREGFPDMTPERFVAMFCATHTIPDTRVGSGIPVRRRQPFPMLPSDEVTRIEFKYVDEGEVH